MKNFIPKKLDGKVLWQRLVAEAEEMMSHEGLLGNVLDSIILSKHGLGEALAVQLSQKLGSNLLSHQTLEGLFLTSFSDNEEVVNAAEEDLLAHYHRDPACYQYLTPLLCFKGYLAIQLHRINHCLWQSGRIPLASYLQSRMSEVFSIDIHPKAQMGKGIMVDHGSGLVIGETTYLGNNISLLHGVTLGGSGKEDGDRHPRISDGVMIGANATILGKVTVGDCARIGAGSVVTRSVPPNVSVAGVPARIVGTTKGRIAAMELEQGLERDLDFII
ncbi:MAG: serine O-acetyltransferase [Neisseriaceae bacterium]